MIRRAIFTGVIALLIAVYAGVATAGTVGKLTGRVTDLKGEALPGVNVAISGTNRGAVTGADGSYFILNVDPGIYQVEASMVGYH
ncbi:carboxypeptidase regulatory-like domain-containing protein, partial [bacterium]|nr:carboxypeptidase regulatory-like domain-containing protein [bacterium]